jgi:hypothetical protein
MRQEEICIKYTAIQIHLFLWCGKNHQEIQSVYHLSYIIYISQNQLCHAAVTQSALVVIMPIRCFDACYTIRARSVFTVDDKKTGFEEISYSPPNPKHILLNFFHCVPFSCSVQNIRSTVFKTAELQWNMVNRTSPKYCGSWFSSHSFDAWLGCVNAWLLQILL